MNDLLKFVSNSLKPFGYHVRKYKAPNILRIPALERDGNGENLAALRKATAKGFLPAESNMDHMVIYVRTCIRANRNVDTSKRLTEAPLEENSLRCLNSLVRAVNHMLSTLPGKTAQIIVLDDRSDKASLEKIESVIKNADCPYEIHQTSETGQGASLHQQFSDSRAHNALVYFCEDGYLHEIDGLESCWTFYESTARKLGTHMVLYPQEHAVLYEDYYPSYLLKGEDRHWRTIRHATHTFITHSDVVKHFWDCFENTKYVGIRKKRKLGSEARTTNKLFRHVPGFSPLKPAAVHLQFENTLPPDYDWKPLWAESAF